MNGCNEYLPGLVAIVCFWRCWNQRALVVFDHPLFIELLRGSYCQPPAATKYLRSCFHVIALSTPAIIGTQLTFFCLRWQVHQPCKIDKQNFRALWRQALAECHSALQTVLPYWNCGSASSVVDQSAFPTYNVAPFQRPVLRQVSFATTFLYHKTITHESCLWLSELVYCRLTKSR